MTAPAPQPARCERCGRILRTATARQRRYGDVCWRKATAGSTATSWSATRHGRPVQDVGLLTAAAELAEADPVDAELVDAELVDR